jgi:hypothetical protein
MENVWHLQEMAGMRRSSYRTGIRLHEPPAKPRNGPVNGLFQGGSRSLKRVLGAEGMRAAFDERQLRLAGLGVAV